MPRYFFDIQNGTVFRDEEGQELSDLVAAKNEAIRALGDAVKDEIGSSARRDIAINIRDESGTVVLRVLLSYSVIPPVS